MLASCFAFLDKRDLRDQCEVARYEHALRGRKVTVCPTRTAYGAESKQRRNVRTFQGQA